ncbi:MAG: hypothetical protein K0S61_2010 [Anaerocolumna sp.]|nr:hypothetical protein [Anaerocolumna sp.]
MKQKKSKFFTFIFSVMFGAGQMYMGFMKQGLSIMGCAMGIIAIGVTTQLGIIYLVLPLLWFYSFFDAINKFAVPDEEFLKLEDNSILPFELNTQRIKDVIDKYQLYIGGGFIFLGICILNNNVLSYIFPSGYFILRVIGPQFLISVLMIAIGLHMILSNKQELFSLLKSQKNAVENSISKEAQIKKDSESSIKIEKVIEFDINSFKEAAIEENKVSMAMFQPEKSQSTSIDNSLNIEMIK